MATPMQVKALAGVPVCKFIALENGPSGKITGGMKLVYSTFVATATALCVAAAPVFVDSMLEPTATLAIRKTVSSSKFRFFFAAGLEGTGHHYITEVEEDLFRASNHLVQIPLHSDVKGVYYTIEDTMGGSARHYSKALTSARNNMRRLARIGEALQLPGTLRSMHGRRRRNSYPMGIGPNKALKYLDLRMLAEVAEAEGVDLRVLYLRRPVKQLVIANTVHRRFHTSLQNEGSFTPEEQYMQYMQVLLTNIAVLHSFIEELGPGFVICHDYERIGDPEQSAVISAFLAPNEDVAELLKYSFIKVAGAVPAPSNQSLPYEGADIVAARLQRKFDIFESKICPGMRHE